MRKTKAILEEELEWWKDTCKREVAHKNLLQKQIEFFEKYSNQGIQASLCESMAKISHALRKTIEIEKTGKPSPF